MFTVRVKAGLSAMMMSSARLFAGHCREIEVAEGEDEFPQKRSSENLSYAAAAVVMAASALEAAINETYLEAVDRRFDAFPSLRQDEVDTLARLWDVLEESKAQVLRKHEIALAAAGREPLQRGEEPYQSAASLLALRNLLVHFKGEWDDDLDVHRRIEERLRDKFAPNQLSAKAPGRVLWFPGQCLGAGCAEWACSAAYDFHASFAERLDIRLRLPA